MSEWIQCSHCKKVIIMQPATKGAEYFCDECQKPDWNRKCSVCDQSPIHPVTGKCGPCTFGVAETVNGNW